MTETPDLVTVCAGCHVAWDQGADDWANHDEMCANAAHAWYFVVEVPRERVHPSYMQAHE